MREILFRGKRVDNEEWAYGYYAHLPSAAGAVDIIYVPASDPDDSNHTVFVDPETIGQFTGLTDKNGVKIFEGDILRNSLDSFTAIVKWGLPHTGFVLEMKGTVYAFTRMGSEIYEVIGNIYDNPELDKGGNENVR